jgi:glutamate-5-semialdehyde dehydrogenase
VLRATTMADVEPAPDLIAAMAIRARAASRVLARTSTVAKSQALLAAADSLRAQAGLILAANRDDMARAEAGGLSGAMRDRLMLDGERLEGVARAVADVAALRDPVGLVIDRWVWSGSSLKAARM